MEWNAKSIFEALSTTSVIAFIGGIIASILGWIRFGKKDKAEVGKLKSEVYIDLATILEKRIADEMKISDGALQWNVNFVSQLEKANAIIDKLRGENERLYDTINVLKQSFEAEFQNLKDSFSKRIKQLEEDLESSRKELMIEKEKNLIEIERRRNQNNADNKNAR